MHHYTEIGELGGALSQHAEKILEGLPGLELAVEQTFRALSETDREGRAVRRAMPFSQLRAETGVPEAELREVLDRFRRDDCSFLTTSPPDAPAIAPDTQIDVGHEALLWRWARMNGGASTPGAAKGQADQGWLADEEDDGLIYRGLLTLLDQAGGETPTLPLRQVEGRWRWWTSRPRTAAWAARYGGKFPEVQRLFDASRRALDAERIRGERSDCSRASTAGFVFGFLLICSALGVAWRQNLQKDEAYRALSASESRFKVSSHAYRAQSDALRGGVVSALTRTASAAKHYEVLERASIAKDVSLTMRQTFVLTFRSAAEVGGILFRKDGMIRAVAFHPSEPLVAYGGTGGQIMVSARLGILMFTLSSFSCPLGTT